METEANKVITDIPLKLPIDRTKMEDLCKRRFFYVAAFSIYGGVKGLYDYGPPGCAIKANLIALWRRHFVLEDNMLEVDCTCLTPELVLETSGHVAKFQDYMVKDIKTNECYRADHLLKDRLEKLLAEPNLSEARVAELKGQLAGLDELSEEQLGAALTQHACKAPETGNDISPPFPFNLMFPTPIGPTGLVKGYLRPETAQGIFMNFAKLLEYNSGKMPFAAAQIGLAFRNEISPRSGLLRVREFPMAEIEYFVHPNDKSCAKFASVANIELQLFPRENQRTGNLAMVLMTIGEAVKKGIVANESLGYFIARTALFLWQAGIQKKNLRFRQHFQNEMAHYAQDCWDAECLTTYGWIECAGHADRSCYDLTVHGKKSNSRLTARETFAQPILEKVTKIEVNKQLFGKEYRKDAQPLIKHLETLEAEDVVALKSEWESTKQVKLLIAEKEFVLSNPQLFTFKEVEEKITGRSYAPHVIEPSFGLGRIIYAILEQSFNVRPNDAQRTYFSLTPWLAPVKCSILPLKDDEKLNAFLPRIIGLLNNAGISSKVDDTGTAIGRKYARTDEIGIPFGITVDFESIQSDTVTLRERDSTEQIRVPIAEVAQVIADMIDAKITWPDVKAKYPAHVPKDAEK